MEIQRLRNITTGRLHTEMDHIYKDVEFLTEMKGVMTHMLPNVVRAMRPWLVEKVPDPRYWADKHDPGHKGEFELLAMSEQEQAACVDRYMKLPHPFNSLE